MSNKVTLGGDRLGAGNKQQVELRSYERSTHDLGYIWRSTMSAGTLVPFMNEVALPGDTFDIKLDCDVKTHPTIGPLFGSYKVQLDVFQVPVRLYQAKLHMNLLNIGLKMADIKLPQIKMFVKGIPNEELTENSQINPSSIYSYLGMRGIGVVENEQYAYRKFNAIPLLGYWDIYKNYYANKVEEIGAYIHNQRQSLTNTINGFKMFQNAGLNGYNINIGETYYSQTIDFDLDNHSIIEFDNSNTPEYRNGNIKVNINGDWYNLTSVYNTIVWDEINNLLLCSGINTNIGGSNTYVYQYYYSGASSDASIDIPHVKTFPLENIDKMRKDILVEVNNPNEFIINPGSVAPYGPPLDEGDEGYCKLSTQEGLGLKTYQSDLFNNWISTEWIDGENGINAITSVDTTDGNFSIDTLQLSKKVYDMLNRIAVSGGSYDDWLNAVYTHERTRSQENPMYCGGLIKELAFQEVVSNVHGTAADGTEQPLGTLAGRGVMTKKNKGGYVRVKIEEPSVILGIVSLTPRIDYSSGNKWSVNLKTMDDFHKPALDEIGFQDLITDQMAWWDTNIGTGTNGVFYRSAGKQPAWLNYMTNVNECRGNFAVESEQMFMTLNRRYERDAVTGFIKDLTTYIDPSKFNFIFADTRLDAQNFWTQIAVDITARRKMSARLMPNL